MTGLLLSKSFVAKFGDRLAAAARESGFDPLVLHLPDDAQARLEPEQSTKIEVAFLTRDWRFSKQHYRSFGDTVSTAPSLKWVHFSSTGVDHHPFLPALLKRGVMVTSSIGSNGEPVAQTAICGLLMLARRFPIWWAAQSRRAWEPMRGDAVPRDLTGQTALIVGLGIIGASVARVCRALGLRVIGVRRSPRPDDPADETHTLAALPELLPRSDWVVLACTHTDETHHLLNAKTLALLPRGAHVVNVARGGVVDEKALIDALRTGHIAGAHLDVFEKEPLPPDSPLWDLPNVIITPHNAQASDGNDRRSAEIFFANLKQWVRGGPLRNVAAPG